MGKDISELDSAETKEMIAFMKEILLAQELDEIEVPKITLKPTKLKLPMPHPGLKRGKTIKIGIASDIEGAVKNAKIVAERMKQEHVQAIILAGDNYESFEIRHTPLYPKAHNKVNQMIRGIAPFARLGVPLFVIPGNHEKRKVYKEAIAKLNIKHPQVIDLENKSYSQDGINIVALGGYHMKEILPPRGFLLKEHHYEKAIAELVRLQKLDEPIIFVTHSPPQTEGDIDLVHMIGHLGDPTITDIMQSELKNIINLHGHIHEAGGKHVEYPSGIALNVASVTDYSNPRGCNGALLTFTSSKVTYKELR